MPTASQTPHPLSKNATQENTEQSGGRLISISQHIFTIGNNGGASAQAPHLSQKTGALLYCGQIIKTKKIGSPILYLIKI